MSKGGLALFIALSGLVGQYFTMFVIMNRLMENCDAQNHQHPGSPCVHVKPGGVPDKLHVHVHMCIPCW